MPKHSILMGELVLVYQGNTWLFCKNNIIQGKKKGTRFDFVQTQAGASILDPSMRARTLGIVIGGLIPLLFIPILEKYITKSENHIMIGDHEDIKKDLEGEHHR